MARWVEVRVRTAQHADALDAIVRAYKPVNLRVNVHPDDPVTDDPETTIQVEGAEQPRLVRLLEAHRVEVLAGRVWLDEPLEATFCTCGNGEAEEDRGAVLRCPVHTPIQPRAARR